jgi:hypothetical protein
MRPQIPYLALSFFPREQHEEVELDDFYKIFSAIPSRPLLAIKAL